MVEIIYKMPLPNFLIVGAAKSGTTSLYNYLMQHPEIFLPSLKEPKYITSSFLKFPHRGPSDTLIDDLVVKDLYQYKALFQGTTTELAIGEASADLLYYYEQAIPRIIDLLGDPRIIIILRNPIERAFSAYLHMKHTEREQLNFKEALNAEDFRKKDNWEFIWFYKEVGLYYNQVKAYLEKFSHVKVCLFEELVNNTDVLMKSLFKFLEVDELYKVNTNRVYNAIRIPKIQVLNELSEDRRPLARSVIKVLRSVLPEHVRRRLRESVQEWNSVRPKMKKKDREYLAKYYKSEMIKLGQLLGKELTKWTSFYSK